MEYAMWISCGIVAVSCGAATLHPRFDDNLMQRIGLGIASIAATSLAFRGYWDRATEYLIFATAIYCVGTWHKFLMRKSAIPK